MLHAIAKMTTNVAETVGDVVQEVLPLPGGKNDDKDISPAGADVDEDTAPDQDTNKASKLDTKRSTGKDKDEGPMSRPLNSLPEALSISTDTDIPTPDTTDKEAQQDVGPEFTTTEKQSTKKGKEEVVTTKDDVDVDTSAADDQDTGAADKKNAPIRQASKAPTVKSSAADKTADAGDSSISSAAPVKSLTSGGQPLPKMSKGKSKWMSSSTAWYPDSAGVLHAPGVYINRKPRATFWNPQGKTEMVI